MRARTHRHTLRGHNLNQCPSHSDTRSLSRNSHNEPAPRGVYVALWPCSHTSLFPRPPPSKRRSRPVAPAARRQLQRLHEQLHRLRLWRVALGSVERRQVLQRRNRVRVALPEQLLLDLARLLEERLNSQQLPSDETTTATHRFRLGERLGAVVPREDLLEGGHVVEASRVHRVLRAVRAAAQVEPPLRHAECVPKLPSCEELPHPRAQLVHLRGKAPGPVREGPSRSSPSPPELWVHLGALRLEVARQRRVHLQERSRKGRGRVEEVSHVSQQMSEKCPPALAPWPPAPPRRRRGRRGL